MQAFFSSETPSSDPPYIVNNKAGEILLFSCRFEKKRVNAINKILAPIFYSGSNLLNMSNFFNSPHMFSLFCSLKVGGETHNEKRLSLVVAAHHIYEDLQKQHVQVHLFNNY